MSNVVLTWVDPTVLKDGVTPAPAGDLGSVQISRSADAGATFTTLGSVSPGVQTYTDENVAPGAYTYQAIPIDTQTPPEQGVPATGTITVPVPEIQPLGPVTDLTLALA